MGDAPAPAPSDYIIDLNKTDSTARFHLLVTGPFALTLAVLLAAGFLAEITRYHYWGRFRPLQVLLAFARSPLLHWIGQFHTFILAAPSEIYLVWGVLLFAGYGSFYSMVKYSIYTSDKKKLMVFYERIQLLNILGMLVLLVYYTAWYTPISVDYKDVHWLHFAPILWLIWGLSVMKILYQIASSYYTLDSSYGSNNTKWVSFYMKQQGNFQDFDPENRTGYRYVVLEEKNVISSTEPNYEIVINRKNLVTVQDVWQSKGRLLNTKGWYPRSSDDQDSKLKEVCLSFALFKMLKRRFTEHCETAEARRTETREFMTRWLLKYPPKTVLRIIDTELKFLRDTFYTKYPTVLGFGLTLYTIHFVILFVCFFKILFKIHRGTLYICLRNDDKIYPIGTKDEVATYVVLFTVMVIEVWVFIRYFFSDWSKVLLVCKYIKYQKFLDHSLINIVLSAYCSIYIPGEATYKIGQYSLLQRCNTFCCDCHYRAKFMSCLRKTMGIEKVKYVRFDKVTIMEALLPSLEQFLNKGWSNHPAESLTTLSRHGIEEKLPSWVSELQEPIQAVMVWHVATNLCWLSTKKNANQWQQIRKKTVKPVAVILSNYCAYMVVHAPELLPTNTYISKLISDRILKETRQFCHDNHIWKGNMVDDIEKQVEDNGGTVINRGVQLSKMLRDLIKEHEYPWDFLTEVWVELMLRLAPSENSIAHATKLAEDGEFMTYLWVLLYHAGFPDQSSLNGYCTSMA